MAHSIQTVGARADTFNDFDLIALICLMLDEVQKNPGTFPLVGPLVQAWSVSLEGYGPGVIELDLDAIAAAAKTAREFDILLSSVESAIRRHGTVPASVLRALSRAPGIEFADYPGEFLLEASKRLRALMSAK